MSRRFWVTCYTDASFRANGAGWAIWLRSVEGRIIRQGPCPAYVKRSLEAELAAIFAGVYVARKAWGTAVRGIVVCTDCQAAIDCLSMNRLGPRTRRKWPATMLLCEKIRGFVAEHGMELELRWVKGHQKTNTCQAFLNKTCDRLAGKAAKGQLAAGTSK